MLRNKIEFTKIGVGIALLGIAASIGLVNLVNRGGEINITHVQAGSLNKQNFTQSNYLAEKGYLDCKDKCSELSKGYEWAKAHNICNPNFEMGMSQSYNIGVKAWAWDNCAYSQDGNPI
jgi:hypothetical protein